MDSLKDGGTFTITSHPWRYVDMPKSILILICILGDLVQGSAGIEFTDDSVRIAYFQTDVTPVVGSPLAFGTVRRIQDSLSARGIVWVFDEKPVVQVAIDWIGVANEGMDLFRIALARAAGTSEDRVVIHALHQHDAVRCDLLTPRLLDRYYGSELYYDTVFLKETIDRIAGEVKSSLAHLQTVTDIGFGEAKVERVASNRRILGPHGRVENMRWSRTENFLLRHEREGLIDPWLKKVTLYHKHQPLVSMSFYAVHPVTDFGDGIVSSEFVGLARKYQEMKRGYPQVYFTGAAGNIGVGKYNNLSEGIRFTLATRMSMAMDEALENEVRFQVTKRDFLWKSTEVYLPLAEYVDRDQLEKIVKGELQDPDLPYLRAVSCMAWWDRVHRNPYIRISALHIGTVRLLSLPGEPFVEYQLEAQAMYPGLHVATAGYEEFGMGYIGTRKAYRQGGYETSKMATMVGPEAEDAMIKGIRTVLK